VNEVMNLLVSIKCGFFSLLTESRLASEEELWSME